MKVAVISLVLLGVLAAICAAVLMATLTSRSEVKIAGVPVAAQEAEVLLAARDLAAMSVVDSSAVIVKKIPKAQVPEGALLNSVQVVGKVLTDRMVANQPFTRTCFAREGTGVYLAAAVPPGKRAMSISLADWSGMAGLLYPGSVVDVLVSFKKIGERRSTDDEMMSTTLLQGLQVLAVGSQSIADDEFKDKNPGALAQSGQINTRMVTLLVDPKQAEILQLASQSGSIALAMRNPLDGSQEARRLTRAREIVPDGGTPGIETSTEIDPFGEVVEPKPPPPPPQASVQESRSPGEWETIIIRGNSSETRTFPLPQEATDAAIDDETAPPAAPKAELEAESIDAGRGA